MRRASQWQLREMMSCSRAGQGVSRPDTASRPARGRIDGHGTSRRRSPLDGLSAGDASSSLALRFVLAACQCQGTGPPVSIWCSQAAWPAAAGQRMHAGTQPARACMPRHACTRPDAAGEAWRPAARAGPGRCCRLGSRQGMQCSFLRWVWGSAHVCSTVFVAVRAGLFWRFLWWRPA